MIRSSWAALPGQTGSTSLAAAALFPLLSLAALGAWVSLDALAREDTSPLIWGVAVAAVAPLIAAYVRYRGERTRPQSDRERLALTLLLSLLTALMIGALLSPPDVFARPRDTFGAVLFAIPLFYLLVYRTGDEDGEGGDEDGEGGDGDRAEADEGGEGGDGDDVSGE